MYVHKACLQKCIKFIDKQKLRMYYNNTNNNKLSLIMYLVYV